MRQYSNQQRVRRDKSLYSGNKILNKIKHESRERVSGRNSTQFFKKNFSFKGSTTHQKYKSKPLAPKKWEKKRTKSRQKAFFEEIGDDYKQVIRKQLKKKYGQKDYYYNDDYYKSSGLEPSHHGRVITNAQDGSSSSPSYAAYSSGNMLTMALLGGPHEFEDHENFGKEFMTYRSTAMTRGDGAEVSRYSSKPVQGYQAYSRQGYFTKDFKTDPSVNEVIRGSSHEKKTSKPAKPSQQKQSAYLFRKRCLNTEGNIINQDFGEGHSNKNNNQKRKSKRNYQSLRKSGNINELIQEIKEVFKENDKNRAKKQNVQKKSRAALKKKKSFKQSSRKDDLAGGRGSGSGGYFNIRKQKSDKMMRERLKSYYNVGGGLTHRYRRKHHQQKIERLKSERSALQSKGVTSFLKSTATPKNEQYFTDYDLRGSDGQYQVLSYSKRAGSSRSTKELRERSSQLRDRDAIAKLREKIENRGFSSKSKSKSKSRSKERFDRKKKVFKIIEKGFEGYSSHRRLSRLPGKARHVTEVRELQETPEKIRARRRWDLVAERHTDSKSKSKKKKKSKVKFGRSLDMYSSLQPKRMIKDLLYQRYVGEAGEGDPHRVHQKIGSGRKAGGRKGDPKRVSSPNFSHIRRLASINAITRMLDNKKGRLTTVDDHLLKISRSNGLIRKGFSFHYFHSGKKGSKKRSRTKEKSEDKFQMLSARASSNRAMHDVEEVNGLQKKSISNRLLRRGSSIKNKHSGSKRPHFSTRALSTQYNTKNQREASEQQRARALSKRGRTSDKKDEQITKLRREFNLRGRSENKTSFCKNYEEQSKKNYEKTSKGRIEDYEFFGHKLGEGAYAIVRPARNKKTGRVVAIKTYNKLRLGEGDKRTTVLREISILESLDHPNICSLIDKFENFRNLHLVLEHCGDVNLRDKVDGSPRLNRSEIRVIFLQLVQAVQHCHFHGITHNDIKMENVVLDDYLGVKLVDFGFARREADRMKTSVCGTPNYMAPELLNREKHFPKPTDVWALGVLLYYMILRRFPYRAKNEIELTNMVKLSLPDLSGIRCQEERDLLDWIFTRNPEERPSCQQILASPYLTANRVVDNPVGFEDNLKADKDSEALSNAQRLNRA